ncbi:MAG: hypothetical protein R3F60_14010 [bacterium]
MTTAGGDNGDEGEDDGPLAWGVERGVAFCQRAVGDGEAVRWWIDVREGSLWRPDGAFSVSDGPDFDFEPEAARVRSCRRHCGLRAGLDSPVAAAFACSSQPDRLDRRAALDGFGDVALCEPGAAPDGFVLPAEDAPYDCGQRGCSYSAWVTDHDCAAVNHCFRAHAPPAFVPPAVGSTGAVGAAGPPWEVCAADAGAAWLAATAPGRFAADQACAGLGYSEVEAFGLGCGAGCDCPADFDGGGGAAPDLEGEVQWRCRR